MLNDGRLRPSHRSSLVTALRCVQQRLVDVPLLSANPETAKAAAGYLDTSPVIDVVITLAPNRRFSVRFWTTNVDVATRSALAAALPARE